MEIIGKSVFLVTCKKTRFGKDYYSPPKKPSKTIGNQRKQIFPGIKTQMAGKKTHPDWSYRKTLEILEPIISFGAIGEIYRTTVSSVKCWKTLGKHVFLSGPAKNSDQ